MDKGLYFKVVRRVCTVLLVLILLVACSAQVHAENEGTVDTAALSAMADTVTEEKGLTEENFSAVAAQLEAVARADGRTAADRMLYTAFSSATELNVSEVSPVSVAESSVNVIVVPEKKDALTFKQILPVALLILAAATAMLAVVSTRRRVRGTVYKPMRSGSSHTNLYANYGMVRTYR